MLSSIQDLYPDPPVLRMPPLKLENGVCDELKKLNWPYFLIIFLIGYILGRG